jgi:hypothetical protein
MASYGYYIDHNGCIKDPQLADLFGKVVSSGMNGDNIGLLPEYAQLPPALKKWARDLVYEYNNEKYNPHREG